MDLYSLKQLKPEKVQAVVQACVRVQETGEGDLIELAKRPLLFWAQDKWPGELPPEVVSSTEFEVDTVGLDAEAISSQSPAAWAFRVRYTDPHTVGRSWEIEVTVMETVDRGGNLSLRSRCTLGADSRFPASSPKFLREWISSLAAFDGGFRLSASPICIRDPSSVGAVVQLLLATNRELPLFVAAQNQDETSPVDAAALARRTCGLAHVVLLHAEVLDAFNHAVGREFGLASGSVRTYQTGFDHLDDPMAHPFDRAWRIRDWLGTEGTGPGAYLDDLVRFAHRRSTTILPAEVDFPNFMSIRRARAEADRARQAAATYALRLQASGTTADSEEELRLLQAEVEQRELELQLAAIDRDAATAKVSELDALFSEQAQELSAVRQERDQLRLAADSLRAGLEVLKHARPDGIPLPSSYEDVPAWVDQTLGDRVILLSRAQRALKGAQFEDRGLLVESLKVLGNEYWTWRTSGREGRGSTGSSQRDAAKAALERRLAELGLDEGPSVSDSTRGKFREQYEVNYELGFKFVQVLDRHLRGGSDMRDPRFCLRVYFFWDDERQKVVVGHLPTHLDTLSS